MKKPKQHKVQQPAALKMQVPDEFMLLDTKLRDAEKPDERDVQRYRELAADNPGRWDSHVTTCETIRHDLMKRLVGNGVSRGRLMAAEDLIKKDLGYKSSSQMEKLLIEQILTTRLHLIHAEHVFNQKIMETTTLAVGDYWQRFYTASQRRHIQSIEALARVRRLMRGGPFVQVNIANAGGKQVNVQGELFSSMPIAASTESKSNTLS